MVFCNPERSEGTLPSSKLFTFEYALPAQALCREQGSLAALRDFTSGTAFTV